MSVPEVPMTNPTLVVSTDLLEPGDRVVMLGAALATGLSGKLRLVHVTDSGPEAARNSSPPEVHLAYDTLRARVSRRTERLTRILQAESKRLRELDVPNEGLLLEGRPWEAIVAECTSSGAALVVVGPHGPTQNEIVRGSLRERLLGSTADRVVRHAPCPVLVASRSVDPPTTMKGARWLVGVDGSAPSLAALRKARALSQATGGTLYVTEIVPELDGEDDDAEPAERLLQQETARRALDRLEAIVREECPDAQVIPPPALADMSVADALCSVATDHAITILCVGTHSRSELSRILLGSTAEKVLRRSAIPVLVVRESL